MFYTGIGARLTPEDILETMKAIAGSLAADGYILRSGGAGGADSAFEDGCDHANGSKEIYLPWKDFNDNTSDLYKPSDEAFEIAKKIYGNRWEFLNSAVRALMARNIHQVMGDALDTKSMFVVCWTPDGCTTAKNRGSGTGGTGQAIAYADSMSIPIFNLANEKDHNRLKEYIKTIGVMEW